MRSRSRSREKKEKTMKAMQVLEKAFEKQPAEEILKALGRFRRYSPANRVLIRFQMPDATLVAGYNAWRKIGRHVKRGEKGIMIIAPVVKKVKSEEEEEEDVVWYRPTYVFDVSQTEGKPVLPSFGERARLEDVEQTIAQSLGAEVREIESGSRQGRVWRDEQGKIVIEVADDDVRTLSFLHEAAHVIAGHLDNPPSTEEEARRYEVVAEGAAFSVLYALGVEAPMNSASHIEMYGRELLREVASEIAEVSDKILDMLRVSDPGLALKEVLEDAS
jgi:hypothetical protein